MSEYIAVSDFAKRANRSRQYIYSQLDKPLLSKYVKIDRTGRTAKKLINTEALKLFADKQFCQVDSKHKVNVDSNAALVDSLRSQIMSQQAQIASLNEQILNLHRLLDQQQQLALAQLKVLPAAKSVHTAPINEQPEKPAEPVKARRKSRLEHLRSIFRR